MKFLTLLKKEVKELLTTQTIVSMFLSLIIFYALGDVMGSAIEKITEENNAAIVLIDNDKTDFTADVIASIEGLGNTVRIVEQTSEDYVALLKDADTDELIIIPKGFTDTIFVDHKTAEVDYISRMKSSSVLSLADSAGSQTATAVIQQAAYYTILEGEYSVPADQMEFISSPVVINESCVVKDSSANISISAIYSYISSQSLIVPIVVFILVMFSSQMIINAIATEKIDKTLETLLSAPVSRLSVLGAKMSAAAIVALLNAAVYMFGFSNYMSSMVSLDSVSAGADSDISAAVTQLGLTMSTGDYILLGLQLFMTILITLCVSLILGALANDAKSTQMLILPITFAAMIPYLISMFADVNSFSFLPKLLIYAIPYTHTFTASTNIMFGNMTIYWIGLGYQVLLFIICLIAALKLFTSDKIFTMTLNLGQRRRQRNLLDKFAKYDK